MHPVSSLISHSCFRNLQTDDWEFLKEFDKPEWATVVKQIQYDNKYRRKLGNRLQITHDAVRLSRKIREDIGFLVFPVIFRLRPGYWQRATGAWTFHMKDALCFDIGSTDTVANLVRKKVKLVLSGDELFGELPPSKKEVSL